MSDTIDALARLLPHAINFRFLPPRIVKDPIWAEAATDLAASLAAEGLSIVKTADWERRDAEFSPHLDEPHEFRTNCLLCGEPGMLHISLIAPDQRVTITETP